MLNEVLLVLLPGIAHITGDFALLVYGLAESKETKEGIYDRHVIWGILTLILIWCPAAIRVFLLARKKNWAEMTTCKRLYLVRNYAILFLIFPVFNALM